jgi:hypothetical protein
MVYVQTTLCHPVAVAIRPMLKVDDLRDRGRGSGAFGRSVACHPRGTNIQGTTRVVYVVLSWWKRYHITRSDYGYENDS